MDVEALDLTDVGVADAVLALQRAAYRVEADLIGSDAIPPLHESMGELMQARVKWLGIRKDGEVIAALAYTIDGPTIDIDRLVVAPGMMRRGLATSLLQALPSGVRVTVSTGSLNHPAHQFYLGHGFDRIGESEPVPGLQITHFERAAHE